MDYDKLIEHLRECGTYGFKQEECRDAVLAIETLRPVGRERVEKAWRGCKRCTATKDEAFDLYGAHNFSVFGDAIYYWDSEYGWEGENILFCPWCGRPLTDEAVQMVMERWEALKDAES